MISRVVCIINGEEDWDIELIFPAPLDQETLEALATAGYTRNKGRKTWCAKRTERAFALAARYTLTPPEPITAAITRFERGEMPNVEFIPFFQRLIDTGVIDQLPQRYGEVAASMIEDGLCHSQGEDHEKQG